MSHLFSCGTAFICSIEGTIRFNRYVVTRVYWKAGVKSELALCRDVSLHEMFSFFYVFLTVHHTVDLFQLPT